MTRIKIDLKSNLNPNFHTIFFLYISDTDYKILQDYDMDEYDDAWDRLCDSIERYSVPGTLAPDWYIDHIDFN